MLDLTNPKHAHVDERLRTNRILWLGSVRPDGRPHLVYVFFRLRWQAHPDLQSAHEPEDTLMLEGKAELLHDPAVNPTLPAYAAKYGAELQRVGLTAEAMAAIFSQALLITPIRFFHRQGTREQRVEVIT